MDKGITIYNQQTKNELLKDFEFVACPQFANMWHWSTWNPHTVVLEDMINGAFSGDDYLPLEDVTELSLKEFYEIYLDPKTDFCVEG